MWYACKTITLNWDPEAVFDYLADMTNIVDWDPSVISARALSGMPPGPGSRFHLQVTFGPARIPMTYRVDFMHRPDRLVLTGRGNGFTVVDDIALHREHRHTRIDYRVGMSADRPPAPVVANITGRLFQRNIDRAAEGLAAAFHGRTPVPWVSFTTRVVDRAIIPGMVGFTRLGYRLARRRRPFAAARLHGLTVVITGATGGIGLAAADILFQKGARLVLVGRNKEKTEATRKTLLEKHGTGDIRSEIADMGRMADVGRLGKRLCSELPAIHVLINNAGALFNAREETKEGLEKTVAVNLLGPYTLIRALLPKLAESRPARVINVASGGMYTQRVVVEDLAYRDGPYDGPTAYARAKRGMVITSRLLSGMLRGTGISVHAMHPGWVDTPGLRDALPGFYHRLQPWLRTPAEGADTIVWLSGAAEGELTSGYFWRDRRPREEYVFPNTRETASEALQLIGELDRIHADLLS
jgi:NAD(P)-dependent dehydrogenase (short-subunit alcohol dehydrogenase family)/carbon monoxide dehydrogenase subunit G